MPEHIREPVREPARATIRERVSRALAEADAPAAGADHGAAGTGPRGDERARTVVPGLGRERPAASLSGAMIAEDSPPPETKAAGADGPFFAPRGGHHRPAAVEAEDAFAGAEAEAEGEGEPDPHGPAQGGGAAAFEFAGPGPLARLVERYPRLMTVSPPTITEILLFLCGYFGFLLALLLWLTYAAE